MIGMSVIGNTPREPNGSFFYHQDATILNFIINIDVLNIYLINVYVYSINTLTNGDLNMSQLTINRTEITIDKDGRYSLNDLHKAAGGSAKTKPALFMQNKNFKDFVALLKVDNPTFSPVVKKRGRYNGGTWVCRELVYKYAMWVNPTFEIKVIRTFDKLMSQSETPSAMDALNELTIKIECDKDIASKCGKALAHYKKVKKENQDNWIESIKSAQLTLGFK